MVWMVTVIATMRSAWNFKMFATVAVDANEMKIFLIYPLSACGNVITFGEWNSNHSVWPFHTMNVKRRCKMRLMMKLTQTYGSTGDFIMIIFRRKWLTRLFFSLNCEHSVELLTYFWYLERWIHHLFINNSDIFFNQPIFNHFKLTAKKLTATELQLSIRLIFRSNLMLYSSLKQKSKIRMLNKCLVSRGKCFHLCVYFDYFSIIFHEY